MDIQFISNFKLISTRLSGVLLAVLLLGEPGHQPLRRGLVTGEGGDVIDFVAKTLGCSTAEAIRWIEARLGIPRPERKPDAAMH